MSDDVCDEMQDMHLPKSEHAEECPRTTLHLLIRKLMGNITIFMILVLPALVRLRKPRLKQKHRPSSK
jgi:hypothetical protein